MELLLDGQGGSIRYKCDYTTIGVGGSLVIDDCDPLIGSAFTPDGRNEKRCQGYPFDRKRPPCYNKLVLMGDACWILAYNSLLSPNVLPPAAKRNMQWSG